MKFTRTEIPDVVIIQPNFHGDDRGFFMETFREDKLADFLGYKIDFCQDNESKSSFGVLRGLHYQLPPFAQTKLVRVIEGRVLDIAVDIRTNSPTFGKHVSLELTGDNKTQLLIPHGFAHGFLVLSDTAHFAYKVDNYYSPEHERGITYNDEDLAIDWQLPIDQLKLSLRDQRQEVFLAADYFDTSEKYI
jgi:dTDP-4-dehydrorhamnose 3,5-epimerase